MKAHLQFEELFAQLVAIDTTSSKSNLRAIETIADFLASKEIKCHVEPNDAGKANLFAITGPGREDAAHGLTLCGHSDTVPAEEPDWNSAPFFLTSTEDRWVGRGTADMKGFLALACERLVAWSKRSLRAPLALLVTYDEEIGSYGAEHFTTNAAHSAPTHRAPKSMLIGEPTDLQIHRLHKGHLRLTLTVFGAAGHSAYPKQGVNAVTAAAQVMIALEQLAHSLRQERTALSNQFGSVPYTVLHVASVAGGDAVNVIPEQCRIQIGVRLLPGTQPEEIVERIDAATKAATSCRYRLELGRLSPPMATDDDASLIEALKRASGTNQASAVQFSSDGGFLSQAGYDCALFGPGSIQVAHRANEFLPKKDVARARSILDAVIQDLCVDNVGSVNRTSP